MESLVLSRVWRAVEATISDVVQGLPKVERTDGDLLGVRIALHNS